MSYEIIKGRAFDVMDFVLESKSVDCIVTSPPYYGLRDYGVAGQIGLESTVDLYVATIVEVFRASRDVLKDDGTLWVNLGDSYSAHPGQRKASDAAGEKQQTKRGSTGAPSRAVDGLKPKDLIGIPWRVAFALQADGWYLRQDIIWHKPNPMPESVRDRCTKAHEYLFLLSKSEKYYFDWEAMQEPCVSNHTAGNKTHKGATAYAAGDEKHRTKVGLVAFAERSRAAKGNAKTFRGGGKYTSSQSFDNTAVVERESHGNVPNESGMRNRRSVWTIATKPYAGAHFATFPPALIEPCILAGSRAGGTVLDPFCGSGTTLQVANQNGRKAIGIEIKQEYIDLAHQRMQGVR